MCLNKHASFLDMANILCSAVFLVACWKCLKMASLKLVSGERLFRGWGCCIRKNSVHSAHIFPASSFLKMNLIGFMNNALGRSIAAAMKIRPVYVLWLCTQKLLFFIDHFLKVEQSLSSFSENTNFQQSKSHFCEWKGEGWNSRGFNESINHNSARFAAAASVCSVILIFIKNLICQPTRV